MSSADRNDLPGETEGGGTGEGGTGGGGSGESGLQQGEGSTRAGSAEAQGEGSAPSCQAEAQQQGEGGGRKKPMVVIVVGMAGTAWWPSLFLPSPLSPLPSPLSPLPSPLSPLPSPLSPLPSPSPLSPLPSPLSPLPSPLSPLPSPLSPLPSPLSPLPSPLSPLPSPLSPLPSPLHYLINLDPAVPSKTPSSLLFPPMPPSQIPSGSGKTTLVQRLYAHMHGSKIAHYLINLDPAVPSVPFLANIDIRTSTCFSQPPTPIRQRKDNGSGKTTLMQRLYAHMHGSKIAHYLINLDPAVPSVPPSSLLCSPLPPSRIPSGSGKTTLLQRLYAHMHGSKIAHYLIKLDPAVPSVPFRSGKTTLMQRLYAHMHGSKIAHYLINLDPGCALRTPIFPPLPSYAPLSNPIRQWKTTRMQRLYLHMHGSKIAHYLINLLPAVPYLANIDIHASTRSGKTTLMQRLYAHMHGSKIAHYLINLDPAVPSVPYLANIDIRDTVNYKNVMKEYGLGPNGAILTSLNLFTTKIDEVITLVERRADLLDYVFIDTPGQIEIFTWSASGAIITEAFASTFPTAVCFVVDTPRAANPGTFISSMLYACGILYKTRLPLLLAFNKTDVARHDFAVEWMRDFEAFQAAVDRDPSYAASLSRSLCLGLDEFYSNLHAVGVSAVTGGGIKEFFTAVEAARKEYMEGYRVDLEKMRAEKEKKEAERQSAEMARSLKRRFKLLANGEYKRWRAGKRHNASTKTKKQRRQLRQPSVVPPGLKQPMRYLGFKR
ncbi:unnamed protein product [Closterium sp. Naga37s-1]|nr:unnamed protein product [Closterium sp. Naga37s-1]